MHQAHFLSIDSCSSGSLDLSAWVPSAAGPSLDCYAVTGQARPEAPSQTGLAQWCIGDTKKNRTKEYITPAAFTSYIGLALPSKASRRERHLTREREREKERERLSLPLCAPARSPNSCFVPCYPPRCVILPQTEQKPLLLAGTCGTVVVLVVVLVLVVVVRQTHTLQAAPGMGWDGDITCREMGILVNNIG